MNKKDAALVKEVMAFYLTDGRHTLPWRTTHNPYRILVSEIMLQQTQVERVIPKYQAFLKKFPTVKRLAHAPLSEVLILWQGLGYNRRAKMLHRAAQIIEREHKGHMPKSYEALLALPGVGPYTAGAVCAFAFNIPITMIETNIRTAYLYHYFPDVTDVSDSMLLPIIARTLPHDNPREWYAALMDYGSYLKSTVGNQSRQSRHYTKQSPFKGSDRYIRGTIVRAVTQNSNGITMSAAVELCRGVEIDRVTVQLVKLLAEGLVTKQGRRYILPT